MKTNEKEKKSTCNGAVNNSAILKLNRNGFVVQLHEKPVPVLHTYYNQIETKRVKSERIKKGEMRMRTKR